MPVPVTLRLVGPDFKRHDMHSGHFCECSLAKAQKIIQSETYCLKY